MRTTSKSFATTSKESKKSFAPDFLLQTLNPPRKYSPLWADRYSFAMANGYIEEKMHDIDAVCGIYFRVAPVKEGFGIAVGQREVIEYLLDWHFEDDEIEFLKTAKDSEGNLLLGDRTLKYFKNARFTGSLEGVPEGSVVYPNELMLQITAPLPIAVLLEARILMAMNYPTLVATLAWKMCKVAGGREMIEMGMRRASSTETSAIGTRAAYIGGFHRTSSMAAEKTFRIPSAGTQAHIWVMSFLNELASFRAWQRVYPNNPSYLVDTYNSKKGVQNAIRVAKESGSSIGSLREDSEDLALRSIYMREELDKAGYVTADIVVSNDLTPDSIADIVNQVDAKRPANQNAKSRRVIDRMGVGTYLISPNNPSTLGGVYKLLALKKKNREIIYKIKISSKLKTTIPGPLQTKRLYNERGEHVCDVIFNTNFPLGPDFKAFASGGKGQQVIEIKAGQYTSKDLLILMIIGGKLRDIPPNLSQIREFTQQQTSSLHRSDSGFASVYIDANLKYLRDKMIEENSNDEPAESASIQPSPPPSPMVRLAAVASHLGIYSANRRRAQVRELPSQSLSLL